MVQLFFHIFISSYVAVLVTVFQVKIGIFVRFHIVSHLSSVIKKSALRVERETSHFHRLSVQRKVSLVEVLPGAQSLRS